MGRRGNKDCEKEEVGQIRRGKKKNGAGFQEANLILLHEKIAAIALASVWAWDYFEGYRELREDEGEFYWDILITERNYSKMKRFWE